MFQRFSFFKQPSHRVFDYQPRYYDERKERIQKRMEEEQLKLKGGGPDRETLERRISFKTAINDRWSPAYRKQAQKSNMRLVIILALLLGVFYVLFTQADTLSRWFSQ